MVRRLPGGARRRTTGARAGTTSSRTTVRSGAGRASRWRTSAVARVRRGHAARSRRVVGGARRRGGPRAWRSSAGRRRGRRRAPGEHLERAAGEVAARVERVRGVGDEHEQRHLGEQRDAAPGPAEPGAARAAVGVDRDALEEGDARRQVAALEAVLGGGEGEQLAAGRGRAVRATRRRSGPSLRAASWCRTARRGGRRCRSTMRREHAALAGEQQVAGAEVRPATGTLTVSATLSRSHGASAVSSEHVRARVAGEVGQPHGRAAGDDEVRVAAARRRSPPTPGPRPRRRRAASATRSPGRVGIVVTVPAAAASWARACSRAPAVVARAGCSVVRPVACRSPVM